MAAMRNAGFTVYNVTQMCIIVNTFSQPNWPAWRHRTGDN